MEMKNRQAETQLNWPTRLWNFLSKPHPSVTEVGERRQAQLIGIIALAVTITNSLGAFIIAMVVDTPQTAYILVALALSTGAGFVISRTKYHYLSAPIIVWALTTASLTNPGGLAFTSSSLYSYLIAAFVIASVGFKFRYMLFYVTLINLIIPFLSRIYPEYTTAGSDLAVFFPFSVLTLAAIRYRDNVERDRLAEFKVINKELEDIKVNLEIRVEERTSDLAKSTATLSERTKELESASQQIQRRSAQFEALAQVAQSITLIRDLQELLPSIANVVAEKYGFYHVGVFLTDEADEYAMLTATNSEGGRRMLERKHRLKVGEQGIVGSVTGTGIPRIALDVGADAVFFNNPDLPETHSEMALPLQSGDKVIGALDVQSTESNAFTDEDVQTLSLLADQVSLAIENARLFEESSRTLSDLQTIMRQSTRDAWKAISQKQDLIGYRYNAMGASPLTEPLKLAESAKGKAKGNQTESGTFVVPIELRGEVIGNLVVQSPTGDEWNTDEQDIIKAVAERVALSAENARLFEETTQRAERERLVSEITGKIRSHTDPNAMIETAVNELKNALGASRVEIIPQKTSKAGRKDTKV